MGATQIASFATDASPSLALWGGITQDANGVSDAPSLALAWRGADSGHLFYSQFPWTTQQNQPKAETDGRPAMCTGAGEIGEVWAWRDTTGTGMSWWATGVTGVAGVPNHAHTVSSPALLTQTFVVDPASGGTDYNLFTLFWQGDASEGQPGTAAELWFMPYGSGSGGGWGTPTRIAGAAPVSAPSVTLELYENYAYTAAVAWIDANGQIWLSEGNPSGDANTTWSKPFPGPAAVTKIAPAITCFQQSILVAWTVQGLGWIMYSTMSRQNDGVITWSPPTRLVSGTTSGAPALAVWKGTLYVAWRDLGGNTISYETFGSAAALPAPSATAPFGVPLPITIAVTGSQYTSTLLLGSGLQPVEVIVDTGSSTLAVLNANYNLAQDSKAQKTALAQAVVYGIGVNYWFGPVVQTQVTLPFLPNPAPDVPLALAIDNSVEVLPGPNGSETIVPVSPFGKAQGILGLGYPALNTAWDLTAWLKTNKHGTKTEPWPIAANQFVPAAGSAPGAGFGLIQSFLKSAATKPSVTLPPLMTQIVQEGFLPDQFALYVHRAQVSYRSSNPATAAENSGVLVLGGGQNFPVAIVGAYAPASIVSDSFYRMLLTSVQVGENPPIAVSPVVTGTSTPGWNAIIDCGTAPIVLEGTLYNVLLGQLLAAVPNYNSLVDPAYRMTNASAGAAKWPFLTFWLAGPAGGQVSLTCSPAQYIQSDAETGGVAHFMIRPGAPLKGSTLGLTLLTGYYTVFDRAAGLVQFAQKPIVYG